MTPSQRPAGAAIPPLARTAVGVDLGAGALWVVALSTGRGRPEVVAAASVPAPGPGDEAHDGHPYRAFLDATDGAAAVAIDAPGGPSEGCHRDDGTIPAKFRTARCAEVALRAHGIAVPWTTPVRAEQAPGWMHTGFGLWAALEGRGHTPLEVYPHGIFLTLLGVRSIPRKQTAEGRALRLAALSRHVDLPPGASWWPHDGIDALGAALVAWFHARGLALAVGCDPHDGRRHDGSAIWLPPHP